MKDLFRYLFHIDQVMPRHLAFDVTTTPHHTSHPPILPSVGASGKSQTPNAKRTMRWQSPIKKICRRDPAGAKGGGGGETSVGPWIFRKRCRTKGGESSAKRLRASLKEGGWPGLAGQNPNQNKNMRGASHRYCTNPC